MCWSRIGTVFKTLIFRQILATLLPYLPVPYLMSDLHILATLFYPYPCTFQISIGSNIQCTYTVPFQASMLPILCFHTYPIPFQTDFCWLLFFYTFTLLGLLSATLLPFFPFSNSELLAALQLYIQYSFSDQRRAGQLFQLGLLCSAHRHRLLLHAQPRSRCLEWRVQ